MQRKITKTAIRDMATPATGQAWLFDSVLPGFIVLCQSSGRKTFMAKYKAPSGAWRKMTLGNCAEMDPEEARERARDVLSAARAGRDPAVELANARQAPTLADMQRRFMEEHAEKLKAGTRRNYEILWRKHIMPRLEPVPKGLSSWRGHDSELGVEAFSERPDVDASYPPPA